MAQKRCIMRCFSRYAAGIAVSLLLLMLASCGGRQPMLLLSLAMVMSGRGGAEFWGVFCGALADIGFCRPLGFNIIFMLTACLAARRILPHLPVFYAILLLFLAQAVWSLADYRIFGKPGGAFAEMYIQLPFLSLPFTIIICVIDKGIAARKHGGVSSVLPKAKRGERI